MFLFADLRVVCFDKIIFFVEAFQNPPENALCLFLLVTIIPKVTLTRSVTFISKKNKVAGDKMHKRVKGVLSPFKRLKLHSNCL